MAGPQVQVVMTGDGAKLERELIKLQARMLELEGKTKGVGAAGRKTAGDFGELGKATERAFDPKALLRWAGVLAPGGILIAGVQLLRAELTKVIELQKKAAGEQVTLASARKDLIRNLSSASDADVTRLMLGTAPRIAGRTGIEERFIQQALASALSAGSGNIPAATAAVEEAAKVFADKPEVLADFAGSLLDLSKVTGSMNATLNRGLLQQVASLSRVVDAGHQATNIPRSLIGMVGAGATGREASALFAALTASGGDITGATTGTAAIKLAEQTKKFFEARAPSGGPWGLTALALRERGATMGERIGRLQENPQLARQFLEGASFEATALAPIRNLLLDAGSAAAHSFAENLKKIGSGPELERIAEQSAAAFLLDPLEKTARLQRAFNVGEQQLLLSDIVGGQGAVSREGVKALLTATGTSALTDRIVDARFELASSIGTRDPAGVAARLIGERIEELRRPIEATGVGTRYGAPIRARTPTENELRIAEMLERLLPAVQAMSEATGELRESSMRFRSGVPTLAPVYEDR